MTLVIFGVAAIRHRLLHRYRTVHGIDGAANSKSTSSARCLCLWCAAIWVSSVDVGTADAIVELRCRLLVFRTCRPAL